MTTIDVLTYASGYDYVVFERFVGSLNDTGFIGNIYIIIKECDREKIQLLQSNHSNVHELIDNFEKKTAVHNHRFFVKQHFLKTGIFTSTHLLLCDFRDVLFQKNIENYTYDSSVDIYGFLEGITIERDQKHNSRWIK